MNIFSKKHDPAPATPRGQRATRRFVFKAILLSLFVLVVAVGAAIIFLPSVSDDGCGENTDQLFVNDSIKIPLLQYKQDTGHFPTTAQGLAALIAQPANEPHWKGPYLDVEVKTVPLDPWGHPYEYTSPGPHNKDGYDCWSDGPDGVSGTSDDVGNW